MNVLFWIIFIIGFIVLLKILVFRIEPFIDQYLLMEEQDLPKRYGAKNDTWALITGPSSGMGEQFAYEFAQRGFNLILVGSEKTNKVIKNIEKNYKIKIKFIQADFSKSFEEHFFDPIQQEVDKIGSKWRILVNNVGYRTACSDYRNMSIDEMKKTISVGTLVQSKLIQMALQSFTTHNENTAIVNITAQNSIYTDLLAVHNDITVPYLACYEATNSYGYFHAKSVYEEIKDKFTNIDFLIITPGAVITENTRPVLEDTLFSVDVDVYVKNIIKLMGNKNGIYCAHWGHSLAGPLLNVFPFVDKKSITDKVGEDFAKLKK